MGSLQLGATASYILVQSFLVWFTKFHILNKFNYWLIIKASKIISIPIWQFICENVHGSNCSSPLRVTLDEGDKLVICNVYMVNFTDDYLTNSNCYLKKLFIQIFKEKLR